MAAVAAVIVLSACGPQSPRAQQVMPVAASGDPIMVMITLDDRGYVASTIPLVARSPVMVMVVNRGTRSHALDATIPMTDVQIDDPAAVSRATLVATTSTFSLAVKPGNELDVTFTPMIPGRYALSADGLSAGTLLVT